jgi:diguanylate cyclase (GGDEF)-like protein
MTEPRRWTRTPEVWALIAMLAISGLACVLGILAPMSERAPVALKAVLAVIAGVLALWLWWAGREPRRVWLHGGLIMCVAGATAIIAAAQTPQGAVACSLGYLWVTVYAAFFLGRTATRCYVGLVGVAFAIALVLYPFPGAVQIWVLVMVTVAIGAEAVAAMVAKLGRLAETDQLTGLFNRTGLQRAAVRTLAEATRRDTPLTVTVIDLDGFKLINDRDGHAAGDRLLVDLATAWQGCLRASDVLARLGGDEFALLLPHSGAEETEAALARLRAASPTHWSAGTAIARPGDDLDDLLARADRHLYLDKGRDRETAS